MFTIFFAGFDVLGLGVFKSTRHRAVAESTKKNELNRSSTVVGIAPSVFVVVSCQLADLLVTNLQLVMSLVRRAYHAYSKYVLLRIAKIRCKIIHQ